MCCVPKKVLLCIFHWMLLLVVAAGLIYLEYKILALIIICPYFFGIFLCMTPMEVMLFFR